MICSYVVKEHVRNTVLTNKLVKKMRKGKICCFLFCFFHFLLLFQVFYFTLVTGLLLLLFCVLILYIDDFLCIIVCFGVCVRSVAKIIMHTKLKFIMKEILDTWITSLCFLNYFNSHLMIILTFGYYKMVFRFRFFTVTTFALMI